MRFGIPELSTGARPVVTWALVAANLLVWLIMEMSGGSQDPEVLLKFGAMFAPYIADGQYWRLFAAMFLHVGFVHLLFNSIGLLIFGAVVERLYGHSRFVAIYILAGLAGSVASYLLNDITVGAGASGAIFGVMGAFAAFFVSGRHVLGDAARQSLSGIAVLLAINLFFGFATPEIDNWAHLGGLTAGFAVGLALSPQYRRVSLPVPFGEEYRLVLVGVAVRRWLVLAAVVAFLVIGATLGTATVPDNAASRLQRAERLIKDERFGAAMIELRAARDLAIEERNPGALARIGQLLSQIPR
ncbi:MAG: rhomboid family intramembrane serine protease [Chloroflexi bacterium]|nr:rhomboid family intramembrane serine protease [Chloroflexota bacterium]